MPGTGFRLGAGDVERDDRLGPDEASVEERPVAARLAEEAHERGRFGLRVGLGRVRADLDPLAVREPGEDADGERRRRRGDGSTGRGGARPTAGSSVIEGTGGAGAGSAASGWTGSGVGASTGDGGRCAATVGSFRSRMPSGSAPPGGRGDPHDG